MRRWSKRSPSTPPNRIRNSAGNELDICATPTRCAGSCSSTATSHGNNTVWMPPPNRNDAVLVRYHRSAAFNALPSLQFGQPHDQSIVLRVDVQLTCEPAVLAEFRFREFE